MLRVRDGEGDLETTSCDVMADVGRTSSKCDEGDPGEQLGAEDQAELHQEHLHHN